MQQFLTNDVLTVKLRYKEPQGNTSKLLAQPLAGAPAGHRNRPRPTSALPPPWPQFGMLLRQSEQRGTATWAATEQLADGARGTDADGYRAELVRLVRLAEGPERQRQPWACGSSVTVLSVILSVARTLSRAVQ